MSLNYKNFLIILVIIIIIGAGLSHTLTSAQTTKPIEKVKLNVPFADSKNKVIKEASDPAEYIKNFYYISLGIGSLLAILMIVIGGIRYTISEAVPSKEDAKGQISSAILGLVLLLASYLILNTISSELNIDNTKNPSLVRPIPTTQEIAKNYVKSMSYNKSTGEIKWQVLKDENTDKIKNASFLISVTLEPKEDYDTLTPKEKEDFNDRIIEITLADAPKNMNSFTLTDAQKKEIGESLTDDNELVISVFSRIQDPNTGKWIDANQKIIKL